MLVLSDVCNTLIDLNSTDEYIDFLYKNKFGNKFIRFLLNNIVFKIFSILIFKIFKYNLYRKITFLFFKGIKKNELNDVNYDFFDFYISKKTKYLDDVLKYKSNGDDVVLVSASVNPPIEMLGKYLGIKFFSSILEEKNGIYTGNSTDDLLGNKEIILRNKIDIKNFGEVRFYTDNLSDIGFISKIQQLSKNSKFYLIINSNSNKKKWLNLLDFYKIKNYEFLS